MSAAPPPPAPPSPPADAPGRPPLRRDREAGIVAGVAAGLARHLAIDVVLVRIAFVVGTILTQGLGVLAYLLFWAFMPKATEAELAAAPPPPARRDPAADGHGAAFWVGVGLLALGAVWFLGAVSGPGAFALFDAGIVIPLLLIGLGVALWRQGDRSDMPPPAAPATPRSVVTTDVPSAQEATMPTATAPPPPSGPRAEDTVPLATSSGAGAPPPTPPAAPGEGPGSEGGFTPPPVSPRRRSLLTRLTLGVALLAVGVLWTLEVTTTISLGPVAILAVGLAIIGAGLLLGSVVGRGRTLILVGVLLLPLVLTGSVLRGLPGTPVFDGTIRGAGVDEVIERPVSADGIRSSYTLGTGTLDLDLREVVFEEDADILVEIGVGEVTVTLPDDVNVEAFGSLGIGELRILDERRSGFALDARAATTADVPDPADAPTLTVRVNGGIGDLAVQR